MGRRVVGSSIRHDGTHVAATFASIAAGLCVCFRRYGGCSFTSMTSRLRTLLTIAVPAFVALAGSANASPVALRVQEPQFRRFERGLKGQSLAVARDLVEQEGVACFDPVGVRALDLKTTVTDVAIVPAPQGGRLDITLTLARIEVRGTVFAEGSFICPDVEETLDPLAMENVVVTLAANVKTTAAGMLLLEVISTSATVGSVTVEGSDTIAWLEEDFGLISSFVPDMVDLAARQGVVFANEQIEAMRTGTVMGIPYRVLFTTAQIANGGIDLAASVEPGLADKGACIEASATPPMLASSFTSAPALDASFAPDSGVIASLAADLPDRVLGAAWWAGLMCGEMQLDPPEELQETLELLTGKESGAVTVRYSISRPPRVAIDGTTVRVDIEGAHVELSDPSQILFSADIDLSMAGTSRIEPDTRLVLGSVDSTTVVIHRLESALADGAEGHAEMKRFLEEDLPGQLVAGMRDVPVADGVFRHSLGRMLLETVHADGGGFFAASPFLEWDPDVDPVAPETTIAGPMGDGWKTRRFELIATDDRPGTIVYTWSLDGGPWSAWSTDPSITVDVTPGDHQLLAYSRDRWGNVDETPAALDFSVSDSQDMPGCACSTTSGSASRPLVSILLALVAFGFVRRRRTLAVIAATIVAPASALADDTRVMPPGHGVLSVNTIYVLNNPPADVTGSSVDIPTGMFPIGIDATAKERHRMEAKILVPSAMIGVYENLNLVAYLPIFLEAKVDVQEFEVHAAGVNVTPQAQQALRQAGFRGSSKSKRDQPISDWRGNGIGDLGVMLRYRAYSDREKAFMVTGGVKVPTGERDDPRILTDFGFGEGQWDVSADVSGERRLEPVVLGANLGYKLKLPGTTHMRPVGGPTLETVRDPGDVAVAGISARGSGAKMPWFGMSGGMKIEHHLADTNTAGIETPDQRGTALVLQGGIGLSNVRWFLKHYKRGRIMGLPMMFNVGVQQSIPLTGNSNLEVFQGTARLDVMM